MLYTRLSVTLYLLSVAYNEVVAGRHVRNRFFIALIFRKKTLIQFGMNFGSVRFDKSDLVQIL